MGVVFTVFHLFFHVNELALFFPLNLSRIFIPYLLRCVGEPWPYSMS